MLEIKNLNCVLNPHFSLQNINISLNYGERVAIVGEREREREKLYR
ncbi:hypothetical protein HpCOL152_01900 [Helicobacter pylori]